MINHNVVGTGTYRRCFGFAKSLVAFGHHVTIYTTSRSKKIKIEKVIDSGVEIFLFPDLLIGKLRNGFCPWNILNRILFGMKKKYDIVHAFDSRPNVILPALLYSKYHSIPLIIDWADWWGRGGTINERSSKFFLWTLAWIETLFEEKFRRFADFATVISCSLKLRLIRLGFNPEKIIVLRHGANVGEIKVLAQDKSKIELGLNKNKNKLLGYLGVLLPGDATLLFESFKHLKKQNQNIQLYLIGNTKINLGRYCDEKDDIILTGPLSYNKVNLYLSACDVLLLPLKNSIASNGRWPSKINDYLAAGKAIVATDTGDVGKILRENKIGTLAHDNPVQFAREIQKLLFDFKQRNCLEINARKYAEQYLDWDFLTTKLLKIYRKYSLK